MADPREHVPPAQVDKFAEAKRAIERRWALCALTGKKPAHKGWQTSKPATIGQVERWLRKGHNLGLRTGKVSGVIVIDDDSLDGSASAVLNLPKTVTVITGSGKRHHYFKAPGFKVGNSVKTVAPGIDIRGDGGQAVFVGSMHPDTKKPYVWAPGLSPSEVEIAELPQAVLEKLRPIGTSKPKFKLVKEASASPTDQAASRLAAYVQAAFDNELDKIRAGAEGIRNDTLNKGAFALGQLVGAGVLDREKTRAALHAAAIAIGLPDIEAASTITSGLDAGVKEPRNLKGVDEQCTNNTSPDDGETGEDKRPIIRLYGGWLHSAVTKAEHILLRQLPPLLYQRGTTLVRIVSLPEAGAGRSLRQKPTIHEVTPAALIDKLTELICWQRVDRKTGEIYTVDCPERVALTLLSRSGSWKLPPLIGVIDCPTLRSDGGVLAKEGYDRVSGLYIALGNEPWPLVPTWPTQADAHAALDKLLLVLKDFPFLEETDRSVALAAILTALIRPALRTAPLFSFRAAKMGSGKTLLADVVSMIAAGRPAAVMSQGADENEDKKRMLPILAEGDPVAVIDNIERPFGSAALCSILTQTVWRDRVLGRSQTMSLPTTNTTWIATGNNIAFVGDITTRTLVCDLDPRCERPEERRFEVNLHHYIPQHRAELVVAGLTLLRAYHIAGRPDMGLPVFGRFEEWSDWVRSALVWMGLADPCETRRRAEETDPVRTELTSLLLALHSRFADRQFQVADVLAAVQEDDVLREAVLPILAAAGQGHGQAQRLGLFFQRAHRRPENGLRLVRGPIRGGSATWRLERV